ncbi:flagellar basal body P-ring protein [Allorhodopirellula solitaria]|uniref:Flagellar basal body P-ring protein n=2 Tax=Allorhodopirellula solitaria TaxID=2527987 RepID=A0A5C5XXK4_9BACT|nr:flagellar basal body P-ring protein [Allorhodopirellula solitaria]
MGCASWFGRNSNDEDREHLQKLLRVPALPDLIREAAIPNGMQEIRVNGVAVVNQLPGTGGPALPSGFRERLLEEMKLNEIPEPNEFLERDSNALVQVRGLIRPGARRGDVIDLQILTPPKTEATDLHGGWLLDTRLRHQQLLQNTVRSSDVLAIGTGRMLTRADYDGTEDPTLQVTGRILSGGVVQSDRKLGLVVRPQFQHVEVSKAIAKAINSRFYFFDGSTRRGIAKATEDDFIEIDVHPRYHEREERLMTVVRALTLAAESSSTQTRLVELGKKLRTPTTAADAALQLEAIGEGAVPTLVEATKLENPELRFYAAEALAYLDRVEAIEPLIDSIRAEPAFRAPALIALQGIDQTSAVAALKGLLDEASLEARYGAMAALRDREDGRVTLRGENLQGQFRLYEIESAGPPAVIVSLIRKHEIVLMGDLTPLPHSMSMIGPDGIVIRPLEDTNTNTDSTRLRISRFRPGKPDAFAEVDANVASLIRGITEVGGVYGDAIATLRMAKEQGMLVDQLAFDPLPKSQRTYYRDGADSESEEDDESDENEEDGGDEDEDEDEDDE